MPYRKRTTYRRKRRPAYKKKNSYVRTVARQEAYRAVNKGLETKHFDTLVTSTAIDYTTGYVGSLTAGIVQGAGPTSYVGEKINPRGFTARIQLTRSDSTQLIRLIIIQDKTQGIPTLSTLLQSVGTITAPLSPLDSDYNNTYRVLYDTCVSMDSVRGTTRVLKIHIPAKKLKPMAFNDSVGTLEIGGVYMCFISDSAASAHPVIDYRTRFWFKDG